MEIYVFAYGLLEFLSIIFGYMLFISWDKFRLKALLVPAMLCYGVFAWKSVANGATISQFDSDNIVFGVIVPIIFLKDGFVRKLLLYPAVRMVSSLVGMAISFGFAAYQQIPQASYNIQPEYAFLFDFISVITLIAVALIRQIRHKDELDYKISKKQWVLVYIAVFTALFQVSINELLTAEFDVSIKAKNITGMLSVIMVLGYMAIWFGLWVNYNRKLRLEAMNSQYREFMSLEKQYIDQLIYKDETMRKFRHDLRAHMVAIKGFAESGNLKEIKEYLDTVSEISGESSRVYLTDPAVNAVVCDLVNTAEKKNIKIECNMVGFDREKIDSIDMCILIANLVNNAIEACDRMDEADEKLIEIGLTSGGDKTYLNVKNTGIETVGETDYAKLKTSKDNSNNEHGWGIKNVREIVQKYDGKINWKSDSGIYQVEILL